MVERDDLVHPDNILPTLLAALEDERAARYYALRQLDRRIATLREGSTVVDEVALQRRKRREYRGLEPSEILRRWADEHDGEVDLTQLLDTLGDVDLYRRLRPLLDQEGWARETRSTWRRR